MSPQTPNGAQGNPPISYVTSPTSARSQTFKRPASSDDEDGDANARPGSRRSAVVKRACNECRQQKVRACARDESAPNSGYYPAATPGHREYRAIGGDMSNYQGCYETPLTSGSLDATCSRTLS